MRAPDLVGNIRVFCRVRPFLPGESHDEGGRGSASDPSKVSKLDVEFPDYSRDKKKIVLHTNEQVSMCSSSTEAGWIRGSLQDNSALKAWPKLI